VQVGSSGTGVPSLEGVAPPVHVPREPVSWQLQPAGQSELEAQVIS
jgi:hypothetical protein